MSHEFSSDDEGKRVVDRQGQEIGVVSEVEGGTAYVEPELSLTETIKSKLGWGDGGEEAVALDAATVETVTDNEIQIGEKSTVGEPDRAGGNAPREDPTGTENLPMDDDPTADEPEEG